MTKTLKYKQDIYAVERQIKILQRTCNNTNLLEK